MTDNKKLEHIEFFTHKALSMKDDSWVYGAYLFFYPNTESPLDPPVSFSEYKHYIVYPQGTDWGLPKTIVSTEVQAGTVCPFTEQFDMYGNPIYVLDMLQYKHYNTPGIVVKRRGLYFVEFQLEDGAPEHIVLFDITDHVSIIGNICKGI